MADESLLKLPAVRERTGLSTSGVYAAMAEDRFPRPLKRGRTSLWIESEVAAWIAAEIKRLPRMGEGMGAEARKRKTA